MALGISGSNGGIAKYHKRLSEQRMNNYAVYNSYVNPLEISYFINNSCNLQCRHCYVGYGNVADSLSLTEWTATFDELICLGARTFGNVGKEPLLTWVETRSLLEYFKLKRREHPGLRFGFVTNGMLLDDEKLAELDVIMPDYIDISLDGNQKMHDFIRGAGAYGTLMANLGKLVHNKTLRQKAFISFTLNRMNAACVDEMIAAVYEMGYRNLLISPYVTLDTADMLYITDDNIIAVVKRLLQGDLIDFAKYDGLNIYVKNDYTTTKALMEKMANIGIINRDELLIDDYGVIFNKYEFGGGTIYFNYMPFDTSLKTAIRISHDGYVSNCLEMFYEDYPSRAVGNVRETKIVEILRGNNPGINKEPGIRATSTGTRNSQPH